VYVAHKCTILAVDPGETSGWAIIDGGRVVARGTCDVFGAKPAQVIALALACPGPLVSVLERPFRVRSQSSTGIGTGDRIWRQRLKEARCAQRVVRVYPPTWRARVLGRDPITGKSWASVKRDDVRAEELRIAGLMTKARDIHPDEAAAVLIGWWGLYSGEVGEKLLTPAQRRAGAMR
jgi:hypothetical protein